MLSLETFVLCTTPGITITLPRAAERIGREIKIKNISTGSITVNAQPGDTIDGSPSQIVTSPNGFLEVESNGSDWYIIGQLP